MGSKSVHFSPFAEEGERLYTCVCLGVGVDSTGVLTQDHHCIIWGSSACQLCSRASPQPTHPETATASIVSRVLKRKKEAGNYRRAALTPYTEKYTERKVLSKCFANDIFSNINYDLFSHEIILIADILFGEIVLLLASFLKLHKTTFKSD